ncbi:TetR family transcriptional regulator [Klenkia sp. PcliD-1-E]|uniref:TetR/AcrR family transcriptional regulator n=1 Tax=Klenkia sp. PcliD-1-E TaxID=2954492 RepID=UPI0020977A16|nr:TetR family transcriptional regulator [Klenkia sp. PcliD-1-E]MCO7221382.1 TetR family transcriptional regulator [Klenkia sp. PcliD-1-E]
MAARPTGRRPGNPDTRDAVLHAARTVFAELGFGGATIRRIAGEAGVDPALVHHYFGSKDELFLAAVRAPVDPEAVLAPVLAGPRAGIGVRLVHTLLGVWDGPAGPALVALLRSAVTDPRTAAALQEFLLRRVLGRIAAALDVPTDEVSVRSGLVLSQVLGLLVARYVLQAQDVVDAGPADLAAAVGPTVDRYLTGDLRAPD